MFSITFVTFFYNTLLLHSSIKVRSVFGIADVKT